MTQQPNQNYPQQPGQGWGQQQPAQNQWGQPQQPALGPWEGLITRQRVSES